MDRIKCEENKRYFRFLCSLIIPVAILFVLKFVCSLHGVSWLSGDEQSTYFFCEFAILFFMSSALSINLRCERFDFSLGALSTLSCVLSLGICHGECNIKTLFVSLILGLILGFISGAMHIITGLSAAVCSICMTLIYEGLAYIATDSGQTRYVLSGEHIKNKQLFFAMSTISLLLVLQFVFKKTSFGYNYRALMLDCKRAQASGVKLTVNTLICYIISGALMGMVGIMLFIREGQNVDPTLNFSSIRILFFAFPSLFLGRLVSRLSGEPWGSLIGALCGGMLFSAFSALDVPKYTQIIISGGMLLLLLVYLSNERKILQGISKIKSKQVS